MGVPKRDLTNLIVGHLVVKGFAGHVKHRAYWTCQCVCGATLDVRGDALDSATDERSCGCLRGEVMSRKRTKHGASIGRRRTAEYTAWGAMRRRCSSSGSEENKGLYSNRGIFVCQRWEDSFESFLEDMGPKPTPQHSIDRKDNDGPYSPDNCRWATKKEQAVNRRTTVLLTARGKTQTLEEWATELGVTALALYTRRRRGSVGEDILRPRVLGKPSHKKSSEATQ